MYSHKGRSKRNYETKCIKNQRGAGTVALEHNQGCAHGLSNI